MRVVHVDTGMSMRGGQWQALRLAGRTGGTVMAPRGSELLREAGGEPLGWASLWRARADLFHAHTARAHTLAAVLRKRPLVVSRRVAFPLRSAWKYRRAEHYIAVSEHVRRVMLAGGVAGERITVVYDGVELPAPAEGGDRVVALEPADALKGGALLRAAGVEIRGTLDFRGASLFVYLSESEGLGSAVLLAMGAGLPVVASRVGGLPEIVEDGVTGLLVENRLEDVRAAIRRIRESPALAARLGAGARAAVERKFTVERMIAGTLDVYRKVLGC